MNHSHRSFGASPNVKRSSALFSPRKRGAGSFMNHSHRSFGASPNVKRSSALFTPRKRGAGGGNTTAANTPALKNIQIGRSLDQTSRFGGMTLLLCASHTTPLDAFAYGSARHDSIF